MKASLAADASCSSKQTKTLFDYFKPKAIQSSVNLSLTTSGNSASTSCPPIIKVNCPGCDQLVSKARINWHLDQDCSSKKAKAKKRAKKLKTSKSTNVSPQKEKKYSKNNNLSKKSSKRLLTILSDNSEDDIFITDRCESPVLFDFSEDDCSKSAANSPNSSQNSLFIDATMVETQLFEDETSSSSSTSNGLKIKSLASLQVQSMLEEDWNIGEVDVKPTVANPMQTKRRTFDLTLPQNASCNTKATLPDVKVKTEARVRTEVADDICFKTEDLVINDLNKLPVIKIESISSDRNKGTVTCSPSVNTEIANKMKPSNISPLSKSFNGFSSPKPSSNDDDDDDDDDFMPMSQSFRTPIKQCITVVPKNSFSKTFSPLLQEIAPKIVEEAESPKSPSIIGCKKITVNEFDELPDIEVSMSSDSSGLYSPPCSPGLVSPNRTPTPSPSKSAKKRHYSQGNNAFDQLRNSNDYVTTPVKTWHTPSKLTPNVSPNCLDTNIKMSPSVKRNMSRFGLSPLSNRKSKKSSSTKSKISTDDTDDECSSISNSRRNLFKISSVTGNVKESPLSSIPNITSIFNEDSSDLVLASSKVLPQVKHSPLKTSNNVTPNSSTCKPSPNTENISLKSQLSKTDNAMQPSKICNAIVTSPEKDSRAKKGVEYREHTGYYLDNFLTILNSVCNNPADYKLFNDDDKRIVETFHGFSLPAKKLYVRLFQRNVKWKRVDKIDYPDICDKADMILYVRELSYANYLHLGKTVC